MGFVSQYEDYKPRTNDTVLIWASLALRAIVVTLLVVVPLRELFDVPEVESTAKFLGRVAPADPIRLDHRATVRRGG